MWHSTTHNPIYSGGHRTHRDRRRVFPLPPGLGLRPEARGDQVGARGRRGQRGARHRGREGQDQKGQP